MAHLPANFDRDPSKIGEKIMFRTREGYVYDDSEAQCFDHTCGPLHGNLTTFYCRLEEAGNSLGKL